MSKNANLNVELPNGLKYILPLIDPVANEEIEAPAVDDSIEKEAVTMIVIRRKKMKKHKLKKLRKRMKFEWAKVFMLYIKATIDTTACDKGFNVVYYYI